MKIKQIIQFEEYTAETILYPHRDNDKPAVIWSDGDQVWCQHGERHRDNDKPAFIGPDGYQEWWQHGEFIK